MTDFRFSGGRKTNGPLIHAFNLMFVPYFSLFNIHSYTSEGENPRFLRQV